MSYYQFSEVLETGVPLIDADHRALIELINGLHDSLEAGAPAADLDDLFEKLMRYAAFHFDREEKMLKVCAYPDYDTHHQEHVNFADYIEEAMRRRASTGDPELASELLGFLKDWLNHHILILDMAYKPYIRDNRLAGRVAEAFETLRPDRYPPSALGATD